MENTDQQTLEFYESSGAMLYAVSYWVHRDVNNDCYNKKQWDIAYVIAKNISEAIATFEKISDEMLMNVEEISSIVALSDSVIGYCKNVEK